MRRNLLWACVFCGVLVGIDVARPADEQEEMEARWQDLQSGDRDRMVKAAVLLRQPPDSAQRALTTLSALLNDPSPDVRFAAALSLAELKISDPALASPLLKAMRDEAETSQGELVCWGAAVAIGRLQLNTVPELIDLISTDSAGVRRAASLALFGLGGRSAPAVPRLIELAQSADPLTRYAGLSALTGIGSAGHAAVPTAIELLAHEDFHTQYWACRVLGCIGAPAAIPAVPELIRRLHDGSASVRGNAARALGAIGPAAGNQILDPLITALRDPSFTVRQSATTALARLGPFARKAGPALAAALDDPQFAARCEAAVALLRTTDQKDQALGVLVDELQGMNANLDAVTAIESLAADAEAAVPSLRRLLCAESAETRWCAVLALKGIGPTARAALPDLQALMTDHDEDVRDAACATVKLLTGDGITPKE